MPDHIGVGPNDIEPDYAEPDYVEPDYVEPDYLCTRPNCNLSAKSPKRPPF